MEKVKAIVLSASPWTIRDENTGILKEGVSIQYVMTDNLKPVVREDGTAGYMIAKESISKTEAQQLVKVPGVYGFTYSYMIRNGKPAIKLREVKFISEVGK